MLVIKGKSLWAKVFEPDTRFVDDGEYSTSVIVPEAEAAEVCEQLESLIDDEYNKVVKEKPQLKATLSKRPVPTSRQNLADSQPHDLPVSA